MRQNATREEPIQKPNKLLSEEEEKQLARKWRDSGDEKAFHRLIEAHIPLVHKIVSIYSKRFRWVAREDLFQQGCFGLTIAAERFNPDLGPRLAKYAVWWIRALVMNYLQDNRGPVRIAKTTTMRRLYYGMSEARRRIEQNSKTEATPEAIAEVLNADPEQVRRLIFYLANPAISIDSPTFHEADAQWLVESALRTANVEKPLDEILAEEQERVKRQRQLQQCIATLDPREQTILREHVLAPEKKTLRQIGERFGVSRERIRQIEQRAKEKIKRALRIEPS